MRRLTLIGVCLAVLGAFAAVSVAGAAAAEPAVYECGKAPKEEAKYESKGKQKTKNVYTGKYTEKHCSTPAPAGQIPRRRQTRRQVRTPGMEPDSEKR